MPPSSIPCAPTRTACSPDSGFRPCRRCHPTGPETAADPAVQQLTAALAADPRVLDTARFLLGSDVYLHQSRINFMPGFAGSGFYWHSDFETWHAEDGMPTPRALSVSLALTPNLLTNGALMIIPGSHKQFVGCVGRTPDDYHNQSLVSYRPPFGTPEESDVTTLADEHGIDMITGPAGSALYFDSNCMHASNGNVTPAPRSNVFIVFTAADNQCGEPFAAPAPRPEFLGARREREILTTR